MRLRVCCMYQRVGPLAPRASHVARANALVNDDAGFLHLHLSYLYYCTNVPFLIKIYTNSKCCKVCI